MARLGVGESTLDEFGARDTKGQESLGRNTKLDKGRIEGVGRWDLRICRNCV